MTSTSVDVALQQHLAQHKVFDDIRKLIRQHLLEQKGNQPSEVSLQLFQLVCSRFSCITVSPLHVQPLLALLALQYTLKSSEREAIADVLGKLSRSPVQSGKLVVGKRYLHVRVQGGKAFIDNLADERDDPSSPSPAILTLFAEFRGQRFRGRPVPAQVEPKFADSFFLPLQVLRKRC